MNSEPTTESVLVYDARTNEEAVVVRATLEAAGIAATLSSTVISPVMGGLDQVTSDLWNGGVFVAIEDEQAARAIIAAAMPTEAELTAEEEADPMTLEEAEAEVHDA